MNGTYRCECRNGYEMNNKQCIDYKVRVKTCSSPWDAGTDATVYITIVGDGGLKTSRHELDSSSNDFEKGDSTMYTFDDGVEVGNVTSIILWRSDDVFGNWKLESIEVTHNDILSKFYYNDWVPVEQDIHIQVTSCGGGFEKGGYGVCVDSNECSTPTMCGAHAQCVNTVGSYICKCHSGYEKRDGNRCVDKNECNQPGNVCQHNCINMEGSYRCECHKGYRLSGKGNCKNINECLENNPCVSPATCEDSDGSYHCNCPSGYRKTGDHNCQDINECMTSNACDLHNSDCINFAGGYSCKCKPGFKQVTKYSCTDIDECTAPGNLNTCDQANSKCVNLVGDFYCLCNTGYHQGANNKNCIADRCGPLVTPYGGRVAPARCQQIKANYGQKCKYTCNHGYGLTDPTAHTLTCGQQGIWQGARPQCSPIKCPALPPIDNGAVVPNTCATNGATYTRTCSYVCNRGYLMSGTPQRQCNADKMWSGSTPTCTKVVQKPWVSCPSDVIVDLKPGQKTADVSNIWKEPTSNVDQITVTPATATADFPYPAGETRITWSVRNSVGSDSCSIVVIVSDQEDPKVTGCPSNPIRVLLTSGSSVAVTWSEPTFTDNVGVVRVTKTHSPGEMFSAGTLNVYYRAYDQAKNSAECRFSVAVKRVGCMDLEGPFNGNKTCNDFNTMKYCNIKCPTGAVIYNNPSSYGFWSCSAGTWTPSTRVPDCVDATEVTDGSQTCRDSRVLMNITKSSKSKTYCAVCPTGTYSSQGACVPCPASQYQDTQGSTTCKACPPGTSSHPGSNKIAQCKVVCTAGKFSGDGLEPGCQVCPADTYQDQTQSTSCKDCPQGSHTLGVGSTRLYDCGAKPVITQVRPANRTIEEGQTVSMSCYVTGTPRPAIDWTFRTTIHPGFLGKMTKTLITNHAATIGLKLTVTKATYENNGVYECSAENSWGKVMSTSSLVVKKIIDGGGSGSFDEIEENGSGTIFEDIEELNALP